MVFPAIFFQYRKFFLTSNVAYTFLINFLFHWWLLRFLITSAGWLITRKPSWPHYLFQHNFTSQLLCQDFYILSCFNFHLGYVVRIIQIFKLLFILDMLLQLVAFTFSNYISWLIKNKLGWAHNKNIKTNIVST